MLTSGSKWTAHLRNGRKVGDYPYVDGMLDGQVVQEYRNGRTARIYHFHKGQPRGWWEAYQDDGELEWRYYFLDGLINNWLRLRYQNICVYSVNSPSYCKTVEQAQHDLGTFLPPSFVDAFLRSLNDLFGARGVRADADTLVACGNTGIAGATLGALPTQTGAAVGAARRGPPDPQQILQDGALADACHSAQHSGVAAPGKVGKPPNDNSELVHRAVNAMDQAAKACQPSTETQMVGAFESVIIDAVLVEEGEAAETAKAAKGFGKFLKKGIEYGIEFGLIAGADVAAAAVAAAAAADQGFDDEPVEPGSLEVYHKKGDPNTWKEVDKTNGTTTIFTKAGNDIIKTKISEKPNPVPGTSGVIAETTSTDGQGNVTRHETDTVSYTTSGSGDVETTFVSVTTVDNNDETTTKTTLIIHADNSQSRMVETFDKNNVRTRKIKSTSNDNGKTWKVWEDSAGGGAGMPDHEDSRSLCERARQGWEHFKSFCEQSQWQVYACQRFLAKISHCLDPALINVSPDGGMVCHTLAEFSEEDSRKASCERLKQIAIINPDSNFSCDPPKMNMPQKDICDDPRAMCAPDGIVDMVSSNGKGPTRGDRPLPRP